MGEPITLYDGKGNPVIVHGEAQMNAVLKAGATAEKPAPPKKRAPRKKAAK